MFERKNPLLSNCKVLFPAALICAVTAGCGGGGGGGEVAVPPTNALVSTVGAGTTGTGVVTTTTPTTGATTTPSFSFPDFSYDSTLGIVVNHRGNVEVSEQKANFEVTFGRQAVSARADEVRARTENGFDHCGYCSTVESLPLEAGSGSQEVSNRGVLPRFAELPEGSTQSFYLLPGEKTISAARVLEPSETRNCTIFAEVVNGKPIVARETALAVARAFDLDNPQRPGTGIYQQVRDVFGSEWNQNPAGGRDGDNKIVLVFYSSKTLSSNLFGYVSPVDSVAPSRPESNRGEILYINGDKNLYQTLATISHEFQHLVNLNQKIIRQGQFPSNASYENTTVNEGLSGLSEEVCGYGLNSGNTVLAGSVRDYLARPQEHEFFDFNQAGLGYGQGFLFFKYVREQFGDEAIRQLATSPQVGMANLDSVLSPGFEETFRRWTVANYVCNLSGNVPAMYKYPSGFTTKGNYPAGTLSGVATIPSFYDTTQTVSSLPVWSAAYLKLSHKPGVGADVTVENNPEAVFEVIFEAATGTLSSMTGS